MSKYHVETPGYAKTVLVGLYELSKGDVNSFYDIDPIMQRCLMSPSDTNEYIDYLSENKWIRANENKTQIAITLDGCLVARDFIPTLNKHRTAPFF